MSGTALAGARPGIVDCDTHNSWDSWDEITPYLSQRWREYVNSYDIRLFSGGGYPRFWENGVETKPEGGPSAGSDVDFWLTDHLDRHNVAYAILIPLAPVASMPNLEFAGALARATNEWQIENWLDRDPRFRASILVPTEDTVATIDEIRRCAADGRFVQVQFSGRPPEPMGRRRYWPIYEVCEELGLPVMSHAFGSAGHPITGAGWASFYIEDHVGPPQAMQANLASMVMEGVFDRFPGLQMVSVESGFSWVPAFCWRLDSAYRAAKSELPPLTALPSEYIAEHVYFATQPIEEPSRPQFFMELFDQHPAFRERLLFSSDYPHWDRDEPSRAIPLIRDAEIRDRVLRRNARALYGLA